MSSRLRPRESIRFMILASPCSKSSCVRPSPSCHSHAPELEHRKSGHCRKKGESLSGGCCRVRIKEVVLWRISHLVQDKPPEFQSVPKIFVRIALGGVGRQKEQLDFVPVPVQPGCGLFRYVPLDRPKSGRPFGWRYEPAGP